MELSAQATTLQDILSWRDLYRQEMNCQVVHDSLHPRKGWCQEYRLFAGDTPAGYGSVVLDGPWKGKPTLFEFYVLPQYRSRVFDLVETLLAASGAVSMEGQTNDPLFCVMLHTFAHDITKESILFHDRLTTTHAPHGAVFRRAAPDDAPHIAAHQLDTDAKWVVEVENTAAAAGDVLFHSNRPYGDVYMAVAEPYRQRGLGSYLVQELKKVCYEQGSVPSARCNPANLASRKTLQKAGFVPCGYILSGAVSL
jgi:GNAT superfamily N-acetyltransferase